MYAAFGQGWKNGEYVYEVRNNGRVVKQDLSMIEAMDMAKQANDADSAAVSDPSEY